MLYSWATSIKVPIIRKVYINMQKMHASILSKYWNLLNKHMFVRKLILSTKLFSFEWRKMPFSEKVSEESAANHFSSECVSFGFVFNSCLSVCKWKWGLFLKSYLLVLMPYGSYRKAKLEVTQTTSAAKIAPIIASLHVPSISHREKDGCTAVRVHHSQATGQPDPTCRS